MTDRSMLCSDSHRRAGKNLGWLGSARRDALCDERRRLNLVKHAGPDRSPRHLGGDVGERLPNTYGEWGRGASVRRRRADAAGG